MIDLMTYQDRVVLMVETPHECPICHIMSYMWVQRMRRDALTACCLGCDGADYRKEKAHAHA